MTNRIKEIDFIRALGALSVIAIHVSGSYISQSRSAYLWNIGMRYAVPLFVIISGFVLYYVESLRNSFSCTSFWMKRLKKLLVPYIIWNFIYLFYSLRFEGGQLSSEYPSFLKELGHNILTGTGTYHLYFVLIVLQLSLLYPFIRLFVKKHMNISLILSFAITLYCQNIIYQGVQNKAAIPQTYIPFFILFPVWLFFYIFGMYLSDKLEAFKSKSSNKSVIAGLTLFVAYIILVFDTKLTNTADLSVKPSVILYSVLAFVFFYSVAIKMVSIKNTFTKIMDFVSEQSFLIYLSHVVFLKLITLFSIKAGFGTFWDDSRYQILLYVTVTVISCIFAYIMSFIPATVFIGGEYKRHFADLYHKQNDLRIEI